MIEILKGRLFDIFDGNKLNPFRRRRPAFSLDLSEIPFIFLVLAHHKHHARLVH